MARYWSNTLWGVVVLESIGAALLGATPPGIWLALEAIDTGFQADYLGSIADEPGDSHMLTHFYSAEFGPLADFYTYEGSSSANIIFAPVNRLINYGFAIYHLARN